MNLSAHLVRWRRLAARAAPLVASSLVHVIVLGGVVAVGVGSTPRGRSAVEAELIVLARDVLPSEPPPPRVAPSPPVVARPPAVVNSPSPPRVSPPAPPPPRPVETPVKEAIVPKVEPAPPPPPREEVNVAPPSKPDPPPAPAPRVDEPKTPAAAEPARGAGGQDARGATSDTRPPGGSPFGAPAPSGTESPGSGRGGSALSGQGGPASSSAGSGGTGVASLPGNAGGSGSGITRSAIPRGGYQVLPVYPSSARQLGIQGTSLLRVHVAADGRVTDSVVARSAGHADMDEAAMAAVRQWRFEPGRRGQEAVAMWVVLPVEFRIK